MSVLPKLHNVYFTTMLPELALPLMHTGVTCKPTVTDHYYVEIINTLDNGKAHTRISSHISDHKTPGLQCTQSSLFSALLTCEVTLPPRTIVCLSVGQHTKNNVYVEKIYCGKIGFTRFWEMCAHAH